MLDPQEGLSVLQSEPDLLRVPPRESDGDKYGVEVVYVEVRDCVAEKEASGFQILVGDGVFAGGDCGGVTGMGDYGFEEKRREGSGDDATQKHYVSMRDS